MLVSELSDSIILFKCIEDNNIQFYCDYDFSEIDVPGDRFAVNDRGQHYGSVEDSKDIYPATKEQRDTLFAKMEESGYKWNAEKKKFKKIETKPAEWSEEDEDKLKSILFHIEDVENKDVIDWLKSIKDRVAWKPSEEQIKVYKEVYADILSEKGFDLGTVNNELNRLEEQLKKL